MANPEPGSDLALNSLSLPFVEELYARFLRVPESVPADWRDYFAGLPAADPFAAAPRLGPSFRPASLFRPAGTDAGRDAATLQDRVDKLVRCYRVRGHVIAAVDPLGRPLAHPPELDPAYHGLAETDLDRPVASGGVHGPAAPTLRRLLQRLRNTYCRSIGAQFMHIDELAVREWLQQRMEGTENRLPLARDEQLRILTRLTDAVIFEEFVQRKFPGAKSFSLEGSESLIPLLDLAIEKAGEERIDEIVLAMAHRGRLNVLANVLGKSPREIFREFDDADPERLGGRGDVKYHLGHSSTWTTASGHKVHLSLCFNPSHLEYVNPMALGRLRAKQDHWGDPDRVRGLVIMIHGDAAFAGEGVVQETLNLSQLEGYTTGGTLHVIVNNQIGFTTPPSEARSCVYATDVAKMLQSPIFHVNGEDPEAVAQAVRLALDFRRTYRRDVVIDMYGYRRRGHNEGDEPAFTQPTLYRAIERRKTVREGYLEHLLQLGGVTQAEADEIAARRQAHLESELTAARRVDYAPPVDPRGLLWTRQRGGIDRAVADVETGVDRARLGRLLEASTRVPAGFRPHPKIERWLETRRQMARGERPLDWAAAESLAFATLATDGTRVRLTGQDSARGTFSQRHAVLHDVEDGRAWTPLQHLADRQAPVEILNSPLSEVGVLGYEYGYSLEYPDALVLWEAQFGDFVNAAQVIVDQFIAAAEEKWRRLSGLVLLLPHGLEGQGPEHSSARLERFLALAAADNLQIADLTTPAQYFHCLRRQVVRPLRKPLVLMTPKSLLRQPRAVSSLDDLAVGGFQRVIAEPATTGTPVGRALLCCGKVYYELLAEREKLGRRDVALVRVEQLYPLEDATLAGALASCADGTPAFWVQEEPENMGAWPYLKLRYGARLAGRLPFGGIARPAAASPATGSGASHRLEQARLLARAFGMP